jgi:hypothetical protein
MEGELRVVDVQKWVELKRTEHGWSSEVLGTFVICLWFMLLGSTEAIDELVNAKLISRFYDETIYFQS